MTPLAHEIYRLLVRRLCASQRSITYGELAALATKNQPTHHRSPALHKALGEVSVACRAQDLPCLPAMVWSASSPRPTSGYYAIATPRAKTDEAKRTAWEREHAGVVRGATRFPPTL